MTKKQNMNISDFKRYQSPFSWRYGSEKMREIWSEEYKYKLWRKIWGELARAENSYGLVSDEELKDLETHQEEIEIERIWEIEKDTRHDVVAAIKEYAEKAKVGGGKIHLGATSMDVVDNADSIRVKESLELIKKSVLELLGQFGDKIEKYADTVCMGYTHLQPAEPTTLGYRFAFYAQDLLMDLNHLNLVLEEYQTKGMKGAVGTQASYSKIVGSQKVEGMENQIMEKLGLKAFTISNQTNTRKMDLTVAQVLESIAQSLYKFAFDLRVLQSPVFGEWGEPFSKTQVGSSAMPFKRNPIKSEQICSLARIVFAHSRVALDNASNMLLERTLDDSANRRVYIPEMFLALDEMLSSATKIVKDMVVNEAEIQKNLDNYAPFSATEEILIETVKKGADRQKMHETLREISMEAWAVVQSGEENPMEELLIKNVELEKYLTADEIKKMLNPQSHIGTAPQRAKKIAAQIKEIK